MKNFNQNATPSDCADNKFLPKNDLNEHNYILNRTLCPKTLLFEIISLYIKSLTFK